jgi:hypothetical protein
MSDNRKKLEELHTAICESLTESIQLMKGMEPKDRNAALYNAAIGLLKNSGVKADVEDDNSAARDLLNEVPFPTQEEREQDQAYG